MINWIINHSLKHPFLTLMLGIGITIGGYFAFVNLPVDVIPDIGENQQIVITPWPGHSPRDVEDQITYPLSTALQGIPGIKTVRGQSMFGFSMIYLIFEDDIPFYFARDRIIEKLAQGMKLPEGVRPKLGPDATALGQVLWYTIDSKKRDLQELREIQDWIVKLQLQGVKGVSEVASIGGYVKQYQIDLNPTLLYRYNIPLPKVINALKNSNIDVGGKTITENDMEYIVQSRGLLKTVEDINNIIVTRRGDTPIYIKEIARVQLGSDFREGILDNGGNEAVGGVITIRDGANPRSVIAGIKERFQLIQKGLPEDITITPFYDRSEMIDASLNTLRDAIQHEVIVTAIVIFLFLFNVIISLMIALLLPLSIAATFIAMYFLKVDANIMSLAGIIIAVGTIVDMGIIFLENMQSYLKKGADKTEGIRKSALEVGSGLLTAVSTTIISFIPVFTLTGQEGRLFQPLAYTKTFLLFSSIVFTLLMLPALSKLLYRPPSHHSPARLINRGIAAGYRVMLRFFLKIPYLFLLIPLGIIIYATTLIPKIGSEYMPPLDEGDIIFMPVTATGVSLQKAKEMMEQQDAIIAQFPEVRRVVGKAGRAATALDPAPVSMFETTIQLKPKHQWRKTVTIEQNGKKVVVPLTKKLLIKLMDQQLKMAGIANIWTQPISNRIDMVSTGIRTEVGVKIFGTDLKKLQHYVKEVEQIVRNLPGTKNIYGEQIEGKPYIVITPRRRDAARYGLNVNDIQQFIQVAIGGMNLTEIYHGRNRFPVRIRYAADYRDRIDKLKTLKLTRSDGTMIPLSYVADITTETGPATINSENGILRAYVLFDISLEDKIGLIEQLKKKLNTIQFETGYSYDLDGKYKHQVNAKKKLRYLVPLSLGAIFLLIYLLFQRVSLTLMIFTAIPVTLSGGIILLHHLNINSSVGVWVGFIALFGIAVDDGIMMMTYLIQKKSFPDRLSLKNHLLEASSRRIRPLLMTTATTLIALIPLLFSTGKGSDLMKPMLIPTIGGLSVELITLFVVPILYYLWERRKLKQ